MDQTTKSTDSITGTADTRPTTSDYDRWVSDPENLALHIAGIVKHLTEANRENARAASIRKRWPYLVNPRTGHLNGHRLCSICASGLTRTGRWLPRLRACRWCLAYDGRQAASFGLRHLLPVFDWPAPPVIDASVERELVPETREALSEAWSAVSILERWRQDSVRLAYGWMDVPDDAVVDLHEWQRRLGVGANRSRSCWDAYVDGYYPALRQALRSQSPQREGQR